MVLFSGLHFEWEIVSSGDGVPGISILKFVPFTSSSYDVSPVLQRLELAGVHGNRILVQGIATGTALVRARLVHPDHPTVPPSTVKLSVIEPFMLEPYQPIYMPRFAFLTYRLRRSRSARGLYVSMPSDQYLWSVTNEKV